MFDATSAAYVPPRSGMTLQDLVAASGEKWELINGERRPILPAVAGHTETVDRLYMKLHDAAELAGLGTVLPHATFILLDVFDSNWVTGSRTPDLMFISTSRLEEYKRSTPDWLNKPYMIVPDLVVEVVSPTDKASELDEKIDLYLADGVNLLWIVYPKRHKVMIYTPDADQPRVLRIENTLDGEDVIPGFRLSLSELFA